MADEVSSSSAAQCSDTSPNDTATEKHVSFAEGTKDDLAKGEALLAQGKRSMALRDYKSAVNQFEEATRILDDVYGTEADACGDAYLLYGMALVELSRLESGLFDGCIQPAGSAEVDDEEDESDNEEETTEDDGDDADEEKEPDEPSSNGGTNGTGASLDEDLEPACSSSAVSTAEPIPGVSTNGDAVDAAVEAAEEAEPTNSEVAWEVLSLAKDVFRKRVDNSTTESDKTSAKLQLAESIHTLGEISLEWENFEAASDLFQEALGLRKDVLHEEDRLIAESYYNIGITFSFLNEGPRATECFRCAVSVFEQRINSLKKSIVDDDLTSEERDTKRKEIDEMEGVLPELMAKIEDSQEQMKVGVEKSKEAEDEENRENEIKAKIHDSPSKPVNNISHLVKRKRNSSVEKDDNGNTDDHVTKKICSSTDSTDAPQS